MTVSGRIWQGAGRARKDSGASSVATMRDRRGTLGSRTSSGDGKEEDNGTEMELEDSPMAPSRSDSGEAVPRVVKRQRTNGDLPASSRASWLVSPAKKSAPAAPTVQVDTSQRLTASPSPSVSAARPGNHLEPPPLSLASDTAAPSCPAPKAQRSSLKFEPAPADPPSSSAAPPSSTPAPTTTAPPPASPAVPTVTVKRSWFGRGAPPAQEAPRASAEVVDEPRIDADGDSDMSAAPGVDSSSSNASSAISTSLVVPSTSSTVARTQARARQLALQKASASIVSQSASKGWFSMLSRSPSTASLAAAKTEASASEGTSSATASADGSAFVTATEGSSEDGSKVSSANGAGESSFRRL